MPPISIELALLAGRAVFLVFCFIIAAIAFTRWRRAADRSTAQFAGNRPQRYSSGIAALEAASRACRPAVPRFSEKLANAGTSATGTVHSQLPDRDPLARSGATREETDVELRRHPAGSRVCAAASRAATARSPAAS